MSRSSIGVKIEQGALAPLKIDDLVLSIAGIPTAGLSVEQAEQHGIVDPEDVQPDREVVVLREGQKQFLTLKVTLADSDNEISTSVSPSGSPILVDRVNYGSGDALVLGISDVPDDLGERAQETLKQEQAKGELSGLVLDLRGNGGGSTDGARNLLGLFVPEATLFPMRRRDGAVEAERAPRPNDMEPFLGPVAVIVDGDTASAAEMIAGALSSYRRAVVLGTRTFGKGCAQEYMDDSVGVGVLRLSTLVYALPDGSPVQRAGIKPDLGLNLPSSGEREASLTHALLPWRGPDLRAPKLTWEVPWPSHVGHVGPCKDEVVCKSLRMVSMVRSATARSASSR
jgi:carboxyl-terminal processing protease